MAFISQLIIYPIKGLCGVEVDELELNKWGGKGINYDREYAFIDRNTKCYINGKQNAAIFGLKLLKFDKPSTIKVLNIKTNEQKTFNLRDEIEKAEKWFSSVLNKDVQIIKTKSQESSYTDDPRFDGPSIVSKETLKQVGEWFFKDSKEKRSDDEIIEEMRDRFRPNIIVDGVQAYWEDNLIAKNEQNGVSFKIGDAQLISLYPIHRCIVPSKNPSSINFLNKKVEDQFTKKAFVEKFCKERISNLPPFAPLDRFQNEKKEDGSYYLCTATISTQTATIKKKDQINSPSLNLNKKENELVNLKDLSIKFFPTLQKSYIKNFLLRGYSIRAINKTVLRVMSVLVDLLPLPLSYSLILGPAPSCVRKATRGEIANGLVVLLLQLFLLYYLISKFFSFVF